MPDATKCSRCGSRPPRPGLRTCERCGEYVRADVDKHRERNRAYEQRRRDAGLVRTMDRVRSEYAAEQERRVAALREWASEHGHIPPHAQVGAIVGLTSGSTGASIRRLRPLAFGPLRRAPNRYARIPYPVPEEWRP